MAQSSTVRENHASGNALQINGKIQGDIHLSGSSNIGHCLRYLSDFDPRVDKARLEHSKGGIREDCYDWILGDEEYLKWKNEDKSSVLWIRGGPGKGKTMISLALAGKSLSEFQSTLPSVVQTPPAPEPPVQAPEARPQKWWKLRSPKQPKSSTTPSTPPNPPNPPIPPNPSSRAVITYFFCQQAYPNRNNASSVLCGLIYLLAKSSKAVLEKVQANYEETGKKLFEEFFQLRTLLHEIYRLHALDEIYFIVDALDECDNGLIELLSVIGDDKLEEGVRVKWFITSREDVTEAVESALKPRLLNFGLIQLDSDNLKNAISAFIRFQVTQLADLKNYDENLRKEVEENLRKKAGGTFLWVALVWRRLASPIVLPYRTLDELERLPSALGPFYDRMWQQVTREIPDYEDVGDNDDDNKNELAEQCKELLRSLIVAYRPLHLVELSSVAELPPGLLNDTHSLRKLVVQCGSFLQVEEGVVSFIHLSAQEYFALGVGHEKIFMTTTVAQKHGAIVHRSINFMSEKLKMDIADLKRPAATITPILKDKPEVRRLAYACSYWARHAQTPGIETSLFSDNGIIHQFLKKNLLHWFEVLSILGTIHDANSMITKLQHIIKNDPNHDVEGLYAFLADASRLLLANVTIIASYPLQAYSSAIAFAPSSSQVRRHIFDTQQVSDTRRVSSAQWIREWPECKPAGWSNKLHTIRFKDEDNWLMHMEFSPNGELLAAALRNSIQLFNAITGRVLWALQHESIYLIHSFTFSADSRSIISMSNHGCVHEWDVQKSSAAVPPKYKFSIRNRATSWTPETSQEAWYDSLFPAVFSPGGRWLAANIEDKLSIWEIVAEKLCWQQDSKQTLTMFSPDGRLLASISDEYSTPTISVWDVVNGTLLSKLGGHGDKFDHVAFSPDSEYLVSSSNNHVIKLWDAKTGAQMWAVQQEGTNLSMSKQIYVAFLPDGKFLTILCSEAIACVWIGNAVKKGTLLRKFKIPYKGRGSFWDQGFAISPHGGLLAIKHTRISVKGGFISLYDPYWEPNTFGSNHGAASSLSPKRAVTSLGWFPDYRRVFSKDYLVVKVWDTNSRKVLRTFGDHDNNGHLIDHAAVSPDGRILVISGDSFIEFWDTSDPMAPMRAPRTFDEKIRDRKIKFCHDSQGLWYIKGKGWWGPARLCRLDINSDVETDICELTRELHKFRGYTVSPDNEYLAIAHPPNLIVQGITTGEKVIEYNLNDFGEGKIDSLAFFPDSKKAILVAGALLADSRSKYIFLDAKTGKILSTFQIPLFSDPFMCSGEFFGDNSRLDTGMGIVSIPPPSSSCATAGGPRDFVVGRTHAHDNTYWLIYGNTKLIAMPEDDQVYSVAVHDSTVILGHYSGLVSWFEFDLKLLEAMFPDSEYEVGVWK